MPHVIREVQTPYTLSSNDQLIGRETIILQRDGQPIAAVVPYTEYQEFLAQRKDAATLEPISNDPQFERERAAFQKLLPELLKEHRGKWVAIVDEKVADVGPDFSSVIQRIRARFGKRPVCVQEVLETPRVYNLPSPHIIRR
jgi:hypothetical protein